FEMLNPVEQVAFSRDGHSLFVASGLAVHSWLVPSGDRDALPEPPNPQEAPTGKVGVGDYPAQKETFAFLIRRNAGGDFNTVLAPSLPVRGPHSIERFRELIAVATSEATTEEPRVRAFYELIQYAEAAAPYTASIAAVVANRKEDVDVRSAAKELLLHMAADP